MNLNPYQNDLLSFYLEKSAARITTKPIRPTAPLVGLPAPKPTPNPVKAPSSNYTVPFQVNKTFLPPPPDPVKPLIGGPTAGRVYRELANPRPIEIDPKIMEDILKNKAHTWENGVYFNNTYYPGFRDIFPAPPKKGIRDIDVEVMGEGGGGGRGGRGSRPTSAEAGGGNGGSGRPPGNTPLLGAPELPGGGKGTPPVPGAPTGRPWYKNPWLIGGAATAGTVGTGALLYNYAKNKAQETTDAAAPTPGSDSGNNKNNTTTPTPNETPESEGWWDSILEWVQENPELAMLILAGGGFAGGALLAR